MAALLFAWLHRHHCTHILLPLVKTEKVMLFFVMLFSMKLLIMSLSSFELSICMDMTIEHASPTVGLGNCAESHGRKHCLESQSVGGPSGLASHCLFQRWCVPFTGCSSIVSENSNLIIDFALPAWSDFVTKKCVWMHSNQRCLSLISLWVICC